MADDNGWNASAEAWIADMKGDAGDWSRLHVLDAPMTARATASGISNALDVGCGEGRFCRRLAARGIATTGIDPTVAMLAEARRRHGEGRYLCARAEALPFADASFDLVLAYLTLIDIDDCEAAIAEMARVAAPGGRVLIANLASQFSANGGAGWVETKDGAPVFPIDDYLVPRSEWYAWRGINVRNWHRPLSQYIRAFFAAGLTLTHFDEPEPAIGGPRADRYRRIPWFVIMEWAKPG